MKRTMVQDLPKFVGKDVEIKGWIDVIREHGKITFLEIRDISGTVQTVVTANDADNFAVASSLTRESCVRAVGEVKARPSGTEKKENPAGGVEIKISERAVLT